jgi:hypothetical protein
MRRLCVQLAFVELCRALLKIMLIVCVRVHVRVRINVQVRFGVCGLS